MAMSLLHRAVVGCKPDGLAVVAVAAEPAKLPSIISLNSRIDRRETTAPLATTTLPVKMTPCSARLPTPFDHGLVQHGENTLASYKDTP